MSAHAVGPDAVRQPARPSLAAIAAYFLRLGATGFGGPIALVGYMERDLVDARGWVTRAELKDGLAFAQLAPGPLAAQLAIYIGWLCAGLRGATSAAVAFVAPSFAMVLALAALYVRYDGIAWLQGAFYGVGAAVIAVIARSAVKLVRATAAGDRLLWALLVASALVTAWTESEIVPLFLASGLVTVAARGVVWRGAASVAGTVALLPSLGTVTTPAVAGTLFLYFASAGMFVFGSGLAIVPFLHGGVVREYGWLTERQFLDAVAVALVTPGPVVITVAFIGFLVAGPLGATAAAAGVFAPVYVMTVLLAPHFDRWKRDARVRAFVDGVTAATAGAIAGAAFVLGRRAIVDLTTALIALAALALLLGTRRVPEPLVVLAAGVVGVLAV